MAIRGVRWASLGIVLALVVLVPNPLDAGTTPVGSVDMPQWAVVAHSLGLPALAIFVSWRVVNSLITVVASWIVSSREQRAAQIEAQHRLSAAIERLSASPPVPTPQPPTDPKPDAR